jgi:ABC-2 type transport system permease protein
MNPPAGLPPGLPASPVPALLYLRFVSLRNGIVARISRLRQPKYMLGALAGGFYLWFFLIRGFGNAARMQTEMNPGLDRPDFGPLVVVFLMVGALAAIRIGAAWLSPFAKPGVEFTEAEIAFLFPAPVTRKTLVHYKLLSAQIGILFTAALLTYFSNRGGILGGNAFTHGVGWWFLFSTLHLHAIGASFTVAKLSGAGIDADRRRVFIIGGVAVFCGIVIWAAVSTLPSIPDWLAARQDSSSGAIFRPGLLPLYVKEAAETGLLRYLLLPFRVLLGPYIAADWGEFARSLPGSIAFLGLHYAWVMRSQVSFEEAAVAQAEKRAQKIEQLQKGRLPLGEAKARPAPFRLDPAGGRPEVAILWKNLLSTKAWLHPKNFLSGAAVLTAVLFVLARADGSARALVAGATIFSTLGLVYVMLIGPHLARQDFRTDLHHADLLKCWPLPSWRIAIGELLTPVAILTGFFWLFLLVLALGMAQGSVPANVRLPWLVSLAALAPFVCTVQVQLANLTALAFPSWVQQNPGKDRGIDVLGQRLIVMGAQFLVSLCLLGPVALFGFLLWFAAAWILGAAGSTLVAIGGAAVLLAGEIALGVVLLGVQFEKLDLSNETIR